MAAKSYRVVTGVVHRFDDVPSGKLRWYGCLTVAPYNAVVEQHEGEGKAGTAAAALKAAVDDLARQGAFGDEGGP